MCIAGLLVALAALAQILMFGTRAWAALCLAAGLTAALLGSAPVGKRLFPAGGRTYLIYRVVLAAAVLSVVLGAPAILRDPLGPESLDKALAKSAAYIAAGKPEQAEALLADMEANHPGIAEVALNLSTVYLLEKKAEEALQVLEKSAETRLFDADRLFNCAMSYFQRGQYEDALYYLKKALRQDPDLEEAGLYAGECARRIGDYRAALYFTRQAVILAPGSAQCHAQLARVHLMAMDYRSAALELETALQLKPGDALRQEILNLQEEAAYYTAKL